METPNCDTSVKPADQKVYTAPKFEVVELTDTIQAAKANNSKGKDV